MLLPNDISIHRLIEFNLQFYRIIGTATSQTLPYLDLLPDHNNPYYLPYLFHYELAMNDEGEHSMQDHECQNEAPQSDQQNSKKNQGPASKRILKDHDLDQFLIYNKRDGRRTKDFYQELAIKQRQLAMMKQQRKKERLKIKKTQKQQKLNSENVEKPKSKSNTTNQNSQSPINQQKPQSSPVSNQPVTKKIYPRSTVYDQGQQDEQIIDLKFPLSNPYLKFCTEEYIQTHQSLQKIKQVRNKATSNSFINCDVKYFNWNLFCQDVGKFDVMLIDPPWRIKGAQKNDSQFMFSNCRFSLQYNTMSNHEIKQLPLHLISDEGFIFLWILNTQLNSSLEIMQSWGYELIEELVWVKLRNEKVYLTHGYYFMHSYEICLVGYKNTRKDGKSMLLRKGVSPNVIFGEVRKKSQKPQDIYNILDIIFKGKKKVQIFARNHNLKMGLFSIGNQLGQAYDKWTLHLKCDQCKQQIKFQTKRYKSKIKVNYDLCQKCIEDKNKQQFFQFANEVDEDVRHEYLACNLCGIQPIWGIRFQCITCYDYDLCENCFDKYLAKKTDENDSDKIHPSEHEFRTLQVPVFGYGFHIHQNKCNSCYQNPIIGVCFSCTSCKNFKLCQKCFFQRPREDKGAFSKTHKPGHEFQVMFQPLFNEQKRFDCFKCKKTIYQNCWMCENCYNFFFCQECYQKRDQFKSLYANTHKKYHIYTKLF